MISGFERGLTFDYFGKKIKRRHDLCPHCKGRGSQTDEGALLHNERPVAMDYEYVCATCGVEWLIRVFRYTGYEKYPGPHSAVIYRSRVAGNEPQDDQPQTDQSRDPDLPF
jgi:hypothetical protein